MSVLKVRDILGMRALVSRQIARALKEHLASAVILEKQEVVLDFSGVEAVSPSFLDELFGVLEETLQAQGEPPTEIFLSNVPMSLSLKVETILRGHKIAVSEQSSTEWRVSRLPSSSVPA